MPTLNLQGVNLSYTTTGTGPPLLLIAGAPGNRSVFRKATNPLSAHFTVTTYDRRGYSHSTPLGPQDNANRLAADASDAAALITHISGGKGAFVFGTSSGAIVAQQVLLHYPDVVRMCIAHEPPSLAVLPDPEQASAFFTDVLFPVYRAQGPGPALALFFSLLPEEERSVAGEVMSCGSEATAEMRGDVVTWFEREVCMYPMSGVDVEGLRARRGQYVACLGRATRGTMGAGPTEVLGEKVGGGVMEIEGGHLGYYTHPVEFSGALVEKLLGEGRVEEAV
ncbi:alpha/beta-hydrolase [Dothidotthia symphoricarpi CBS 119687]|uniref:Alpha/beta-hydrolase n=1 Tax=Dothidotthia symphoricarpi CBS 119687 TaxID=1392245 RepID=A0A6A6AHR1_9PLEO|nr:alpha/beta-hydrolase [Dothidotthia symphoricarpi CBS 119687]KAF2130635.1 alpha/beta-hydrolase [Dothidotthia symphoricarpi CBS 119687]